MCGWGSGKIRWPELLNRKNHRDGRSWIGSKRNYYEMRISKFPKGARARGPQESPRTAQLRGGGFDGTWQRSLLTEDEGRLHGVFDAGIRSWLSSIGAIIPFPTRRTTNLCVPARTRVMLMVLHLGWNKHRESRAKNQVVGRAEMENKAKSRPPRAMTWWNDPDRQNSSIWKLVRNQEPQSKHGKMEWNEGGSGWKSSLSYTKL